MEQCIQLHSAWSAAADITASHEAAAIIMALASR